MLPEKQGLTWSGPTRTVGVQLHDSLTSTSEDREQILCFWEAAVRVGVEEGSSPNLEPEPRSFTGPSLTGGKLIEPLELAFYI